MFAVNLGAKCRSLIHCTQLLIHPYAMSTVGAFYLARGLIELAHGDERKAPRMPATAQAHYQVARYPLVDRLSQTSLVALAVGWRDAH